MAIEQGGGQDLPPKQPKGDTPAFPALPDTGRTRDAFDQRPSISGEPPADTRAIAATDPRKQISASVPTPSDSDAAGSAVTGPVEGDDTQTPRDRKTAVQPLNPRTLLSIEVVLKPRNKDNDPLIGSRFASVSIKQGTPTSDQRGAQPTNYESVTKDDLPLITYLLERLESRGLDIRQVDPEQDFAVEMVKGEPHLVLTRPEHITSVDQPEPAPAPEPQAQSASEPTVEDLDIPQPSPAPGENDGNPTTDADTEQPAGSALAQTTRAEIDVEMQAEQTPTVPSEEPTESAPTQTPGTEVAVYTEPQLPSRPIDVGRNRTKLSVIPRKVHTSRDGVTWTTPSHEQVDNPAIIQLTDRERLFLLHIAQGKSLNEAIQLASPPGTEIKPTAARGIRDTLRKKFGVNSSTELFVTAIERGYVDPSEALSDFGKTPEQLYYELQAKSAETGIDLIAFLDRVSAASGKFSSYDDLAQASGLSPRSILRYQDETQEIFGTNDKDVIAAHYAAIKELRKYPDIVGNQLEALRLKARGFTDVQIGDQMASAQGMRDKESYVRNLLTDTYKQLRTKSSIIAVLKTIDRGNLTVDDIVPDDEKNQLHTRYLELTPPQVALLDALTRDYGTRKKYEDLVGTNPLFTSVATIRRIASGAQTTLQTSDIYHSAVTYAVAKKLYGNIPEKEAQPSNPLDTITPRQRQIINLTLQGYNEGQIAEKLSNSDDDTETTVKKRTVGADNEKLRETLGIRGGSGESLAMQTILTLIDLDPEGTIIDPALLVQNIDLPNLQQLVQVPPTPDVQRVLDELIRDNGAASTNDQLSTRSGKAVGTIKTYFMRLPFTTKLQIAAYWKMKDNPRLREAISERLNPTSSDENL